MAGFWEHEDARQAANPGLLRQDKPLHLEEARARLAAIVDLCDTAKAFGMGTVTVGEVLAAATGAQDR